MASSLDYIHTGTHKEFVDVLLDEVYQHPALNHLYLQRLSSGRFPDIQEALKDYAHQYSFYSNWFTKYLDAVLANLNSEEHRTMILENLEEEMGNPDSDKMAERPHVEIFADFKNRLGVNAEYEEKNGACDTALIWRDLFLQKCQSKIDGIGLGAVGLSTEYIVPHFYPYFIQAIENHTDLGEDGSLFFRLHVECDCEHGDDILQITSELAKDISKREAIRFGTLSALNLRKAFWDAMLARALAMQPKVA